MTAGCLWRDCSRCFCGYCEFYACDMRAWRSELFVSRILFTEAKNASKTYIVVICCHALPGLSLPDLLTLGQAVFYGIFIFMIPKPSLEKTFFFSPKNRNRQRFARFSKLSGQTDIANAAPFQLKR